MIYDDIDTYERITQAVTIGILLFVRRGREYNKTRSLSSLFKLIKYEIVESIHQFQTRDYLYPWNDKEKKKEKENILYIEKNLVEKKDCEASMNMNIFASMMKSFLF